MASESTIRLLIIENSRNDAEAYNTAVLTAGVPVRSVMLKKSEELPDILRQHFPDVIIINAKNILIKLTELVNILKKSKRIIPVIVVCDQELDMSVVTAMQTGARDRVLKQNLDHLKTVVVREYEYALSSQENEKLKKAYQESEARCRNLLDSSRDAIAYVHEGMHVYANKTYLETFGFEDFDDLEGLPILDLVAPEKQSDFKSFFRGLNGSSEESAVLETELKDTEDSVFKGKMEFQPAAIDGEPCIEIVIRKEIDSKLLEEQLNKLSQLDTLTGLFNRPSFIEELNKRISKVKDGSHFVLFEVGLDRFKEIQEKVGLLGSDAVIAEMANLIKKHLKETYIAGRYEGSRYLILTDHKDEKALFRFAETLIKATANHICDIEGKSINIHCSIGACNIDDETLDVNEIIARSEKAYFEASETGKDKFKIYKPKEGEMTQKQLDTAWVKRIRSALDKNRFKLLFQPIVQLDGANIERYEVFVEMLDEQGERVSPNEFLPAAERTQMSKIIDRWVISNALTQLVTRLKITPNTLFFIKLTGASLEDTQLFRWISERIKEHDLPKGRLIFEVKEEAVISNLRQAQAFATLLKTIHCGFAIDDFGTGPEPFKLLEHVPAQYLKFDKVFTQDLAKNEQNQDVMTQITDKAKSLNKSMIVQRVEDAATLSVLWNIGAKLIQGKFFQGPSEKMEYDFSSGVV